MKINVGKNRLKVPAQEIVKLFITIKRKALWSEQMPSIQQYLSGKDSPLACQWKLNANNLTLEWPWPYKHKQEQIKDVLVAKIHVSPLWPWLDGLGTRIWIWTRYGQYVPKYKKSFYVNSFKSYSLKRQTHRQSQTVRLAAHVGVKILL